MARVVALCGDTLDAYRKAGDLPRGSLAVGVQGAPYLVMHDGGIQRFVSLNSGCKADLDIRAKPLGKNEGFKLINEAY